LIDATRSQVAAAVAAPLADAVLRWRPIVGRDERPIGFELGVGAGEGPLSALLDSVLAGFADETSGLPHGLVLLAPLRREPDDSLAHWGAPRNVLIELDARRLVTAQHRAHLAAAQRRGLRLALRAPGPAWPCADQLAAFQYAVVCAAAGRPPRDIAWLATGATTLATRKAALAAGASGVIGAPLDAPAGDQQLRPQQRALLNLIRLVQSDADTAEIEREFKRDPMLAYMLLTLANSPAFLRAQPIGSLGHAIRLLGYRRLVKWLVLLLVIASKQSGALAAIYCAVLRGLLLENCAAAARASTTVCDQCFVVGAFSLLDRITGRPLPQLTSEVTLPADITDALNGSGGPYADWLELACALEDDDDDARGAERIEAAAAAVRLPMAAVNASLLKALAANDALQTLV